MYTQTQVAGCKFWPHNLSESARSTDLGIKPDKWMSTALTTRPRLSWLSVMENEVLEKQNHVFITKIVENMGQAILIDAYKFINGLSVMENGVLEKKRVFITKIVVSSSF